MVAKGRLRDPRRIIIYGPEGVGKSSLAADAPAPLFLDIEDGTGRLDVARYPFGDGALAHVPSRYSDVLAAVDDLIASDHPYQTLVIDTLDRLEALLWRHMIERDQPSTKFKLVNIESYGYGKGYAAAVDEWRALALKLDRLRVARGMTIVLLAHAQIRTFKNPEGEDFDRYQLRLNDKAAGFLREWSDVTGFACFEESGVAIERGERARGVSTGRRLLRLNRSAAHDAKSRDAIPAELEIPADRPWALLAKAIDDAANLTAGQLEAAILAECERIGDGETTAKVVAAMTAAAADTAVLHRFLINLKNRTATPKEEASANV